LNALKSGAKVSKRRLVVGDLPPQLISVRREARAYRRDLEGCVLAAKGEISLTDAHLIDTAAAATVQAGIIRWLMKHRMETMTVADIRGCSQDQVRAKERRDAAVRALGLDAPPPAPWAVIDSKPRELRGPRNDANTPDEQADESCGGGSSCG
jgi:hypothetical protein